MQLNIEVDLNEFYDSWGEENIEDEIKAQLKAEIMKRVKRDPKYKAFVETQAFKTIESLEV